ncbi:hypothetical protein, partial [Bianquea renquensis]|uniref:hypothetical protein n=1 Tax=Bianquea renquensis TaxID=2763661 RepID=UPI0020163FD6
MEKGGEKGSEKRASPRKMPAGRESREREPAWKRGEKGPEERAGSRKMPAGKENERETEYRAKSHFTGDDSHTVPSREKRLRSGLKADIIRSQTSFRSVMSMTPYVNPSQLPSL